MLLWRYVCVSASVCCCEGVCEIQTVFMPPDCFLLLLEQVFGVYYTFFPPFFFLCWFILDFIAKGLPSGRCQPALDRATDKEARVGPQSCTSHTLANSLQPESLVVILLGFFCLFSPDGETSSIRCLIFPQHSLCHKCTVCVHLLLPSLPSRVGFFFFFFFNITLLRLGWKPDVLIAAHRRAEWLSVLCWLARKSWEAMQEKNKDKKETILDYYRDVNIFV